MNEDTDKEKSPCLDKNTFLAEIERLYIEGYPTRDIAQLLGVDGNKVGRNLREIKRRWARAAGRQRAVLSQTQSAAVYREAMRGWQNSQQPKLTTTEHRDADGKAVKTTIRRQEGPGDKTFLLAAVSALKTVRQFAADLANAPKTKDGKPMDAHYLALLQILRPEQLDELDSVQIKNFCAAIKNVQAIVDDARRQANGGQDAPAGSPAADEAGPPNESAPNESAPSESAPQEPGGDSAPSGGEAAPSPADPQPGTASASVPPLETEPTSDPTGRTSSSLPEPTGACVTEPAKAESEDARPAEQDPRSTEEPTGDSCPTVATLSEAATAAPAAAVSTAGLGAMPYPPVPLLNGKPPTPEVHQAYQQWQDGLWHALMPRPLFGNTLWQPSPPAPVAAAE